MSKKLSRRYVAVFGRTLDEVATNLEDQVNKLIEDGYEVQVEPKITPPTEIGYGYMIHGVLPDKTPQVAVMPMPIEFLRNARKKALGEVTERADAFLSALSSKLTTDWEGAEKEIPTIVPQMLQGLTASDIETLRADLEQVLAHHDKEHVGETSACPFHRGLTVLISLLKDNVRLHLQ